MARSCCIAVVSGARCGSSLVAGILNELGVFMGESLQSGDASNELGHFEDMEFQKLHKAMIGDWRDPHPVLGKRRKPYRDLIRKRETLPLWGLKDPRLCFTFPYLVKLLRKSTELLVVYAQRDTAKAAASMLRRAEYSQARHVQVTAEQAEMLAQLYRQTAENALIEWGGPVYPLDYDQLVDSPDFWVKSIAAFARVEPTAEAIAMVRPELRHL